MTVLSRLRARRPRSGAGLGEVLALGAGLALAVPASARATPDGPAARVAGSDVGATIVAAARGQVGVTVRYDGSYARLPYPGGDVPPERGVCTDVLVRAYRAAGIDLQVLVHEDMKAAWDSYPKLWGLARPDPSIDHRRVPNLVAFFGRHGVRIPPGGDLSRFRPGDVVTWRLPSGLPHVGIVSDRTADGRPLILHNIGAGVVEEDVLFEFPITGHFRYPRGPAGGARAGS